MGTEADSAALEDPADVAAWVEVQEGAVGVAGEAAVREGTVGTEDVLCKTAHRGKTGRMDYNNAASILTSSLHTMPDRDKGVPVR